MIFSSKIFKKKKKHLKIKEQLKKLSNSFQSDRILFHSFIVWFLIENCGIFIIVKLFLTYYK